MNMLPWPQIAIPAGVLVLVALLAVLLTRHRILKKVTYMLDALEDKETNFRFDEGGLGSRKINRTLNRIRTIFQKETADIREQEEYYGQMLDKAKTGIVVLESGTDSVLYTNKQALILLGVSSLSTLRQLDIVSPSLRGAFEKVEEGLDQKASIYSESSQTNISLSATSAHIGRKDVKIIAVNDISEAIEENESVSWTRLIRVLTHEIMNTVTPIASLSEALSEYAGTITPPSDGPDLKAGLETIASSSRGLIKFVNSYRDLTHVAVPVRKAFFARDLAAKVIDLSQPVLTAAGATAGFVEKTEDVLLYADESQISQILINLVKNAAQAGARHIEISAEIDKRDNVIINVSNDGPPISAASQEEIFIPFFTTKPEGSGIGLSLSRQIMRMHGGVSLGVGHHNDGRTFLVELAEEIHDLLTVLGVQVTCRLIGEDQLRTCDHGTGDGDSLLLTSGKLLREVLGSVADGHSLHNLGDLLLTLGRGDVQVPQRKLDVLIDIQFIDQVEALEHESDVALTELGALLFLELADLRAEKFVGASGRVVKKAEDVQKG